MSNIAKLKQKASEFEQKKQYEKALELYEQVLNFTRSGDEDRDVALYNRVGDLHYRLGNSEQAIHYYEKATDLYAEGGFFNNAIALCNKILRYSPGRNSAYYKLGLISAKKGFNSDAKQNFLEYADRMQKIGKMDEAFRALKEFADLCPGQDDVRLMLAEQLARVDRKEEALEQLQLLYHTLESEGRTTEATAAVARMKAIDPTFTPQQSTTPRSRKSSDGLVFLDLDEGVDLPLPPQSRDQSTPDHAARPATVAEPRTPAHATPSQPTPAEPSAVETAASGLELTYLADEPAETSAPPKPELIEAEPALPRRETPAETAATERQLRKTPTPIELAPLVEAPEEPIYMVDETPIEFESEQPADTMVPTLHETSLVDPLAGLDVIEAPASEAEQPASDDNFVDLGEWLASSRTPQSTRMVTHDEEPEDNQQKDFAEMLQKFKEGVAQSLDVEDFASHYDLGVAFREMGLVDEAIAAFQKALRGPGQRIRASEALGECFIDKGEPAVAVTVLERVLRDQSLDDEKLIGVLYLMGKASEALGKQSEATSYYQRVFAVDIGFRDIGERMSGLTQAAR